MTRTSVDREYVASLTGLRGLAAVSVFIFHYDHFNPGIRLDQTVPLVGRILQFPLGLGWVGVDLFFVLSGFLLALPFAGARVQQQPSPVLGRYFRRRGLVLRRAPLGAVVAAGAASQRCLPVLGSAGLRGRIRLDPHFATARYAA